MVLVGRVCGCPFPSPSQPEGGAQAPSPGREACLYVRPPANDVSSSLCPPQDRAQDVDLPWVLHTGQWDKGWNWQSLGLHGDEPGASAGRGGIVNYQLPPIATFQV